MKACPQCHIRYPTDTVHCLLDGAELAAINDPLIGKTIAGCYVIEDMLGEGGMSTVYRARHKLVDRPCAIKVMNPVLATDTNVRERFRREARSTQAIAHPNVIEIFDQGEMEDGIPYIVMDLLDGSTLSTLVDAGPIASARSLPIMIQVARGIARAHDLGVVHRDLKPDNIFICRRAERGDLVKILDFGIARSRADTRLTNAGELFGTPQYMAPERITAGEAGPSVDLYALGVIFFEMATGQLPFNASDPATFLIRHMKEVPPPPRKIDARVPERLEALVLQLLEKDPRSRPVDAHRVEHDLVEISRALRIPVPAEPEADPSSSRPAARTLPAASIDQWSQRVEVFEDMAARAYGPGVPDSQARSLADLKRLVREYGQVRASSAKEQRALEDIDARGRDGRQRLGFAVDALGLDASKARDELRAARTALEEPAEAVRRADGGLPRDAARARDLGRSLGPARALQAALRGVPKMRGGGRRVARRAEARARGRRRPRGQGAQRERSRVPDRRAPGGAREARAGHRPRPRRRPEAGRRAERAPGAPRAADAGARDGLLRASARASRPRPALSASRAVPRFHVTATCA